MVGLLLDPTVIDLLRLWPFASAHDSPANAFKDFSEIGVIMPVQYRARKQAAVS
jgi:hypothetical protein